MNVILESILRKIGFNEFNDDEFEATGRFYNALNTELYTYRAHYESDRSGEFLVITQISTNDEGNEVYLMDETYTLDQFIVEYDSFLIAPQVHDEVFQFTLEQLEEYSIANGNFYSYITGHLMGIPDDFIKSYDCRYITISKNVFDLWGEYYVKQDGYSISDYMMLMLQYGPKIDYSLDGYQAHVLPGFATLV